ncbi:MAG: hypothetical protein NC313_09775, partial [Butyrivibrio sp.]|nr:hypothetical protein [Butyrivibrio sp.]
AAKRLFAQHPELQKEVDNVTERLIRLPSDEFREWQEKLEAKLRAEYEAEYKAEYEAKYKAEYKAKMSKQEMEIARQREENAKLTAEIRRLQEQLQLAGTN